MLERSWPLCMTVRFRKMKTLCPNLTQKETFDDVLQDTKVYRVCKLIVRYDFEEMLE